MNPSEEGITRWVRKSYSLASQRVFGSGKRLAYTPLTPLNMRRNCCKSRSCVTAVDFHAEFDYRATVIAYGAACPAELALSDYIARWTAMDLPVTEKFRRPKLWRTGRTAAETRKLNPVLT